MPEGPEIRRAADEVADAIQGKIATRVTFGLDRLKPMEVLLSGHKVVAVETYGKAMLTRFEHGQNIYSHNQLYGRWYTAPTGQRPDISRQLRLSIETADRWALLYSASDIAVLPDAALADHPFLSTLGPDVLDSSVTVETIEARLSSPRYRNRRLGNFLTEQRFVAGLGNYLRCEILFWSGLAANIRPADLDGAQRHQLAENILALPRQSYRTGGITNTLDAARKLLDAGATFEQARFHVFRRAGKPCYRCGNTIEKITSGGQACYWCPGCQQTG